MLALKRSFLVYGLIVFGLGFTVAQFTEFEGVAEAQSQPVFELRTYTTHPGRLDALNARFRNHTTRIFEI